jgi:5'-nucleotidase
VSGISLSGLASFQNNTGAAPVTVSANKINGSLSCAGNTPAPGDNGAVNTVSGSATGQCATLAVR